MVELSDKRLFHSTVPHKMTEKSLILTKKKENTRLHHENHTTTDTFIPAPITISQGPATPNACDGNIRHGSVTRFLTFSPEDYKRLSHPLTVLIHADDWQIGTYLSVWEEKNVLTTSKIV